MTPTVGPTTPTPAPPVGEYLIHHTNAINGDGLRHVPDVVLDAREYNSTGFSEELVRLLGTLQIVGWGTGLAIAGAVKIDKVSGSLTNAVFFVSHVGAPTVLLRIYGRSSGSLVSRREELHVLKVLSSRYGIGPQIYGTFGNGRVEEYFEADALTAGEMRTPEVSAWIGMRMAELHGVELTSVGWGAPGEEEGVRRNVRRWLGPAREVVRLARERGHETELLDELDLERFVEEWEEYWRWLMEWERVHGESRRVFAHNDTQYGNLLRLRDGSARAHHQQIIVVDFEYASMNAAAFDIANHFAEWMADYHSAAPAELDGRRYPTAAERRRFYRAYTGGGASIESLEDSVQAWQRATHAMWAVWGIVQGREGVIDGREEFSYLRYACGRMRLFRDMRQKDVHT